MKQIKRQFVDDFCMALFSALEQIHCALPSTGHENNTVQPKTDVCLSSPSHFSSFFTVQLLFKCHFVA